MGERRILGSVNKLIWARTLTTNGGSQNKFNVYEWGEEWRLPNVARITNRDDDVQNMMD